MKAVEPASVDEVADVLTRATRERQRVSIRGAGTKGAWGAPVPSPPVDVVLSTGRMHAVLAHRHGDLTATVQAGASLADVNRALAQRGQWIPLDPPWADRATIGGLVATNDSGPRRHRYGAPRDLIIGIDFVRANGVAAKAGGIVVKNVAGYDLARLLTGSFGCLAVVVGATFKLFPLPPTSRTVVVDLASDRIATGRSAPPSPVGVGEPRRSSRDTRASGGGKPLAERVSALVSALLGSPLTPTAIELQTPPARLLVRFETIEIAAEQQADAFVRLAETGGASASVAQGDEETAVWADHSRRPWEGDGAVFKVTLVPSAVGPTLDWLADTARGADYEVIGRAGVGVLLARVGGDVECQVRVLNGLRERLPPHAGSAVLVRGSDELKSRVDIWGAIGDGLAVMRAVKQQFDPQGILNPGRGPGGL